MGISSALVFFASEAVDISEKSTFQIVHYINTFLISQCQIGLTSPFRYSSKHVKIGNYTIKCMYLQFGTNIKIVDEFVRLPALYLYGHCKYRSIHFVSLKVYQVERVQVIFHVVPTARDIICLLRCSTYINDESINYF